MNSKNALFLILPMLFLTACSLIPSAPATPTQPPATALPPDESVSSDETPQPGDPDPSWDPAPGDDQMVRGEVEVEGSEILTLESFPPQFMLHLTGWKGNPCQKLRVVTNEPDDQSRIEVEMYTVAKPDEICVQMLEGFDINVPLGSPEAGEYTIWVNGEQVGEIMAP